MASQTVYAVTSGEYSDYGVDRIFEIREDARAYADTMDAGQQFERYRVEEFDFHPAGQRPTVYTLWHASIDKRPLSTDGRLRTFSQLTTDKPKHEFRDTQFAVSAQGPDKERCVKSVSDRYAKWKAEQEGVL